MQACPCLAISRNEKFMIRHATRAAAITLLGLSTLSGIGARPAWAGTFSDLAGSWAGTGTLNRKDGASERLRCQARYDVEGAGEQMNLRITCASDSFKFDLTGYIINSGGTISGQWSEPNYNSTGSMDGRASEGRITAHAVGNTFSAQLSVTTQGNRQAVTIQPQETDVTRVSLTFQKR
jgi:hypothetical protein